MTKIKNIYCREVFGPQGKPAIESTVVLEDGSAGIASVSQNEFEGKYAAVNLAEREQNIVHGQGTLKAVEKVRDIIAPKLTGMEASAQQEIDAALFELDGTSNKSRFGASAMLSVSTAVVKAGARSAGEPLYVYLKQFVKAHDGGDKMPVVIFSLINGGRLTGGLPDFKDFFVIPASFKSLEESLLIGTVLQEKLGEVLKGKQITPLLTSEGGYGVSGLNNEMAFSILAQAIEESNLHLGFDVFMGIDADAGNFYSNEKYHLRDNGMPMSASELIGYYRKFVSAYHILYIEDPLCEDDWDGWEKIDKKDGNDWMIIGEKLTASNPGRLQMAIGKKAISGAVIKPIQIGTISESIVSAEIAHMSGFKVCVGRQSGGTMDDFLADFAVAINADYVDFGPLTRGENVVNYNRLLTIEKHKNKS